MTHTIYIWGDFLSIPETNQTAKIKAGDEDLRNLVELWSSVYGSVAYSVTGKYPDFGSHGTVATPLSDETRNLIKNEWPDKSFIFERVALI